MYKLRAELRAHSSDVRGVAVSSEGVIATASRDKTVVLWGPDSVEPKASLRGHDHFVNAVAFATPEKLVTASSDETLRVWDVESAECLAVLQGHSGPVCAISVLPGDGGKIASASWDKTARVWDIRSGSCDRVLRGHEAAVWSVCGFPDGRLVTVAADKTVRLWPAGGGESVTLAPVHSDVVRDVIPGPKGGFITVANDSTMVYWGDSGGSFTEARRLADLHDGSYAYSVDGSETSPGSWLFVSGGEDNSVRVIEADLTSTISIECTQTVMHPGTVWDVSLCPGGDFVSGCSDGVARVFTRDPAAVAEADVLASFEKAVSERQVNTKVIGGVDVNKLPELESALSLPGRKDGENKIVKTSSGTAEVHMWSAAEGRWTKVGEVVDNPATGGGGSVNGKSYDFVFEVEIGEGGKKEKLGYNRGENPYLAAQRFMDDNELSPEFLDQIAQFIEQQVPADALQARGTGPSDPLTGGARYVPGGQRQADGGTGGDPLTGGSRYVPGGQGQGGSSAASDPLTGGSRYVPGGSAPPPGKLPPPRKLIPHQDGIILYKSSDQLEKIQTKLSQFNTEFATAGSPLALNQSEAEVFGGSLMPKLKVRGEAVAILEDKDCAVLEKLLKWPTSHAFPVLDIGRLVISVPSGCAYFFGARNGAILEDILNHLSSPGATAPVYIMACRFLCNMFGSRVSGEKARSEAERILAAASAVFKSPNRRARETSASLFINYAVMMRDSNAPVADKATLIQATVALISGGEKDEDVLYRLMIAMGTIICDDVEAAKKGVEIGVAQAAADAAPISARIQQIALEIATIIAA